MTEDTRAWWRDVELIPRDQMTWVRTYDEANDILKSPDFFSPLHYRHSYPVVGESIQSLFGETHSTRRRAELVVVSRAALVKYEFELVLPIVEEGLSVADSDGPRKVDLLDLVKTAVMRVAAAAIGLDDVTTPDEIELLSDIGDRVSNGVQVEWSLLPVDDVIAEALRAKAEFVERFYGPAKVRRVELLSSWRAGGVPDSALPHDVITSLLKADGDFDDDLLLRECLFWLSASTATTIHASAHVFMEIWNWLDAHPEDRPLFDDLAFLQRAVGEAMRLHPPIPAQLRCALRDLELTSGRRISKGEQIALDLNAIGRDRRVFGDDSDRFDPHRQGVSALHVYGVSFGQGAHACLGRRLAIGAGNGKVEGDVEPAGLIVRLMEVLLRQGATVDPDDPPTLRATSTQDRWARFPLVLCARDHQGVGS